MLTETSAYRALSRHHERMRDVQMRDLFARDPQRFRKFSLRLGDLLVDYSKHRIEEETLSLLFALARETKVLELRDRMFAGDKINLTENRAVLHVALRNRSNRPILVDGKDVMPEVNAVLARMRAFTERVRSGAWRGATGSRITDIVNIGIGGSDLGPVMVTEALRPDWQEGLRAHFVSNVDSTHLAETVKRLDAASTLFIVASKTFTTQETLMNARSARGWLTAKLGEAGRAAPREHAARESGSFGSTSLGRQVHRTIAYRTYLHLHRTGSWGTRDENGKFVERARIDVGEAGKPGERGQTHIHIDGGSDHLPVTTKLPVEK